MAYLFACVHLPKHMHVIEANYFGLFIPFHTAGDCKTRFLSSRWCCHLLKKFLRKKFSEKVLHSFIAMGAKSFILNVYFFDLELNQPWIAGL